MNRKMKDSVLQLCKRHALQEVMVIEAKEGFESEFMEALVSLRIDGKRLSFMPDELTWTWTSIEGGFEIEGEPLEEGYSFNLSCMYGHYLHVTPHADGYDDTDWSIDPPVLYEGSLPRRFSAPQPERNSQ